MQQALRPTICQVRNSLKTAGSLGDWQQCPKQWPQRDNSSRAHQKSLARHASICLLHVHLGIWPGMGRAHSSCHTFLCAAHKLKQECSAVAASVPCRLQACEAASCISLSVLCTSASSGTMPAARPEGLWTCAGNSTLTFTCGCTCRCSCGLWKPKRANTCFERASFEALCCGQGQPPHTNRVRHHGR